MKYFKNTELAKLYHISEKSVRNWIEAAEAGKISLQLHEENGRKFIINTFENTRQVEQLALKGKKFKNTRGFKVVQPTAQFYELYNQKQIYDIVSNIDVHGEIPLQYCYFNGGAEQWDKYAHHLLDEGGTNPLTNTVQLLDTGMEYIDQLLQDYTAVNVIDIGVGNALPVKKVLQGLVDKGVMRRYIGIDTSNDLLEIAQKNIKRWFGDKVKFEGYVKDISYERFDDLLVQDAFNNRGEATLNLVFFLGGTIANFREPERLLSTIRDSMGKNDLFLMSRKLDDEKTRRHFDVVASGNLAIELVPHLLNIDPSYYEIEQLFDEKKMAREAKMRLKVALLVKFELDGKERSIELNKGASILLWRAKHQSVFNTVEQLDTVGLELLQLSRSYDQQYILTTTRIKVKSN